MSILVFLLVAIGLGTALVSAGFFMCWYFERRNFPEQAVVPDETSFSPWLAMLGMVKEWLALTLLVVSYPLRLLHDASPVRTRKQGETPLILVHGYGGNSANFLSLQWRLKLRGWNNVYSVSYTPPHINARKLSQQVVDHVERILAATGAEKANLICHSMGGPLTRYAIKNLGLDGKIDRVITLGSPHHGSRIAALMPALGAVAQLRYQSPFINELAEGGECPGSARYFSIYSNMDNFILPVSSAILDEAEINTMVPYLGHCGLLFSRRVLNEIERCLLLSAPTKAGEPA